MPVPRWRLILNGKAAGNEAVRDAVGALRADGVALDVRVTWEHGDARRHVDNAVADGIDTVIAGGGDGTLGEVASALARHGMASSSLPSLGILPLGTANDFATAAGIPDEPLEALWLVRAAPARPVDLLEVTADEAVHWAVNLASGGFGTQVTVETSDGLKKLLGGLAYLITGMSRLGRIEPIAARVRGPGFEWAGGFIALGVGNGRQAGGGQALCPDALLDDGLLDVTIVPSLEGEVAATIGAVFSDGKEAALERVAVRAQLPWMEIDAPQPFHLNLDGEPVPASRFRIACRPACVRIHLPPGCPLVAAGGPAHPAT